MRKVKLDVGALQVESFATGQGMVLGHQQCVATGAYSGCTGGGAGSDGINQCGGAIGDGGDMSSWGTCGRPYTEPQYCTVCSIYDNESCQETVKASYEPMCKTGHCTEWGPQDGCV